MNTYQKTFNYFRELSQIPRRSLHEDQMRTWIIQWAERKGWQHSTDTIGNLLIIAPGSAKEIICLQSHLDMVCVAKGQHNFAQKGVTIEEIDGVLKAKDTSLGADNGIGVAVMMALAELENRPNLELLFTIGEEIGLVGAHNISLPITAPYAINLDWCNSDSIGIGCGGTLLIQGTQNLMNFSNVGFSEGNFLITLHGMQGGHSGEDIRHYRGNAIIELLKLVRTIRGITHIGEMQGGEADNVIPHSSTMVVHYEGHPNLLQNELSHIQKILRKKYTHDTIALDARNHQEKITLYPVQEFDDIINTLIERGTGVQTWGQKNTPLSSWNLGVLSLKNGVLKTSYFLRSNIPGDIERMETIFLNDTDTEWSRDHRSPPWINIDKESDIIKKIQEFWVDEDIIPLPAITTHAAVECGLLAEKYPKTQWTSVGATVHNMHTTEEYITMHDLREFTERIEKAFTRI